MIDKRKKLMSLRKLASNDGATPAERDTATRLADDLEEKLALGNTENQFSEREAYPGPGAESWSDKTSQMTVDRRFDEMRRVIAFEWKCVCGSQVVYYFSDGLFFDEQFERHSINKLADILDGYQPNRCSNCVDRDSFDRRHEYEEHAREMEARYAASWDEVVVADRQPARKR